MEIEQTGHNDNENINSITKTGVMCDETPLENYSQMLFSYKTFEELTIDLVSRDQESQLKEIKTTFEDKHSWKACCEAIDNLRAINKFATHAMKAVMKIFWLDIIECIESERSSQSKNALVLTQEIFLNTAGDASKNPDFQIDLDTILRIYPLILQLNLSAKNFIKTEAAKTIKVLATHCLYDNAIIGFCREVFNKNLKLCDIANDSLCKQIANIDQSLSCLHTSTIKEVLITLAKVIHSGRREKRTVDAKKTINLIYKILGKENYQKYVEVLQSEENLTEKLISNLTSVYVEEKPKVQKKSIKELMAEKKKLAAQQKSSNGMSNELGEQDVAGKNDMQIEDNEEI